MKESRKHLKRNRSNSLYSLLNSKRTRINNKINGRNLFKNTKKNCRKNIKVKEKDLSKKWNKRNENLKQ